MLLRAIAEQAVEHIPPGTEVLAGLELVVCRWRPQSAW